jgi:hypothetical protein
MQPIMPSRISTIIDVDKRVVLPQVGDKLKSTHLGRIASIRCSASVFLRGAYDSSLHYMFSSSTASFPFAESATSFYRYIPDTDLLNTS